MIVPDSSVWISFLHGHRPASVERLIDADPLEIAVGDLVLLEVLQGARSEKIAREIESRLREFTIVDMLGEINAIAAARNYRALRGLGITPKRIPDLIIATFCIEGGHSLLHQDGDYDHFARHLKLRVY